MWKTLQLSLRLLKYCLNIYMYLVLKSSNYTHKIWWHGSHSHCSTHPRPYFGVLHLEEQFKPRKPAGHTANLNNNKINQTSNIYEVLKRHFPFFLLLKQSANIIKTIYFKQFCILLYSVDFSFQFSTNHSCGLLNLLSLSFWRLLDTAT